MLVTVLLAGQASASTIVVNEVYRDTTLGPTGTEWVEYVLLEDLTAAELEAFSFGDSNTATDSKISGYSLVNAADFAAVFPAGTILVIAGGAVAEDLTYDPTTDDWNLVIRTNDPHVVTNGSSGDLASTDVAYVDTDGTNGGATLSAEGFAVCWDSTPGAFGAVATVAVTGPANPGAIGNLADLADADLAASWGAPTTPTPGVGNGGTNDSSLLALRASCADADGDGVCDVDDLCPGFDDNLDDDTDGVANGCDLRLQLTGTVAPGQVVVLRAVRAFPGETVSFRWSPGGVGVGPCPANLGGHCFDLGNPTAIVGNAVANANGSAQRMFTVPAGTVVGSTITFQAAIVRGVGGVDSDLTQPIPRVVQP